MYCVGLTGNIGSGKSTVSSYFKELGIDIIDADKVAKDLTVQEKPAFTEIVLHFGKSILSPTGDLNRRQLRQLIFDNVHERLWLENLLHPLIRKEIEQKAKATNSPYCVIEIPLLKDKLSYPYLNRVLVVQASHELQISRFMARDNSSKDDALAILAAQTDLTKQKALADDLILNTGTLKELKKNVKDLHKKYLELSSL